MEQSLEQIREQQKQAWNKTSSGWKKWNDFKMNFLRPMGEAMITKLELKDTDTVLDIATGTGEPGLSIAAIVKNGKVSGSDLSEEMLALAAENAAKKGLTNYSTQVADVCDLPFDDNSFDAISCRFGFMFFPDMLLAAKEMVRVLKPGGRLAITVWAAADQNAWITAIMSVIRSNIEVPSPAPGAPGMFRCAQPGLMSGLLQQAGLNDVKEESMTGKVDYGDPDFYWIQSTEPGSALSAAMAGADEVTNEKIRREVYEKIATTYPGALFPYGALLISGKK